MIVPTHTPAIHTPSWRVWDERKRQWDRGQPINSRKPIESEPRVETTRNAGRHNR
ncbi:hypothetical protein ATJ93_1601 [Halopiger aswanensis]|uniref:Uncharacterized protein n=1 Tax=Halopiger aswanensis TaxID=148449 RepID=A0A3R7GHU3_9EURY|nr:hypothetical protein ATJ93_1601 [Halopiger aswanensis]